MYEIIVLDLARSRRVCWSEQYRHWDHRVPPESWRPVGLSYVSRDAISRSNRRMKPYDCYIIYINTAIQYYICIEDVLMYWECIEYVWSKEVLEIYWVFIEYVLMLYWGCVKYRLMYWKCFEEILKRMYWSCIDGVLMMDWECIDEIYWRECIDDVMY